MGRHQKRRELVLPFPPLQMDGVRQLVQEFSCCAPADERLLRGVTGGYAGFSEIILDETAKAGTLQMVDCGEFVRQPKRHKE